MACLLICPFVIIVSHAKMAEPIKIPFGMVIGVGERNEVLDGGPVLPQEGAIFGGWCGDLNTQHLLME